MIKNKTIAEVYATQQANFAYNRKAHPSEAVKWKAVYDKAFQEMLKELEEEEKRAQTMDNIAKTYESWGDIIKAKTRSVKETHEKKVLENTQKYIDSIKKKIEEAASKGIDGIDVDGYWLTNPVIEYFQQEGLTVTPSSYPGGIGYIYWK